MHISNNTTYLIVEDDAPKLAAVLEVVREFNAHAEILIGASVASALNIISENKIDVAIIDMSLPAYDFAKDVSGGEPQNQGGQDILRFLEDFQPDARAIILTQYAEFISSKLASFQKLDQIAADLSKEFGTFLVGVLYYSGRRGQWIDELKESLKKIRDR